MKKQILITIGVIIIILLIGIILLIKPDLPKKSDIDITKTITPSEVYIICDENSCPSESVIIQGNMERSGTTWGNFRLYDSSLRDLNFSLSDALSNKKKVIYIDLRASNVSLIDTIIFQEKIKLEKEGIVEVRVKGTIHYYEEPGMEEGIISMKIEPDEIEIIKEVKCRDTSQSRSTFEPGDCFDVSYRKISLEDAYANYFSSTICTEKGRRPSGYFEYDAEEDRWNIGIYSPTRKGGCSESCHVYENKVEFVEQCAATYTGGDLTTNKDEEYINLDLFKDLYEECIKGNLDDKPKYGPAKDEPIGATRVDRYGRIWIKEFSESGALDILPNGSYITSKMWRTNAIGYEGTSIGDSVVDEWPGAINYGYYPIECDVYLKRSLQVVSLGF